MSRANAGSGQAIRPLIGRPMSERKQNGPCVGGGICELAGRGWQQTCHIGCETLDDMLAVYQRRQQYQRQGGAGRPGLVPGSTASTGNSVCTRRACTLHVLSGGPFGVALGAASSLPGGRAAVTVRRLLRAGAERKKEAKKMGKLYCSKGMQRRVRGGRLGHGKQTQMSSDSGAG